MSPCPSGKGMPARRGVALLVEERQAPGAVLGHTQDCAGSRLAVVENQAGHPGSVDPHDPRSLPSLSMSRNVPASMTDGVAGASPFSFCEVRRKRLGWARVPGGLLNTCRPRRWCCLERQVQSIPAPTATINVKPGAIPSGTCRFSPGAQPGDRSIPLLFGIVCPLPDPEAGNLAGPVAAPSLLCLTPPAISFRLCIPDAPFR